MYNIISKLELIFQSVTVPARLTNSLSIDTLFSLPQYNRRSLHFPLSLPTNSDVYYIFLISNSRSGQPSLLVSFGWPKKDPKHLAI